MKVTETSSQKELTFILDFLETSQRNLYESYHKNLGQAVENFANTFLEILSQISPENKPVIMKAISINQKLRKKMSPRKIKNS